MAKMEPLDWISTILLLVGGLNWGLVGIFKYNLVEALLGSMPTIVRVVYGLVGIASVYGVYGLFIKK